MDYRKIYADFIASRQRSGVIVGYTELHHIVPRSLGGSDEVDNLIRLTARDHFFAHCCLAKIHGSEMWTALNLMTRTQKSNLGARVFSMGRMFAIARAKAASVRSLDMQERWAAGFNRNRVYAPATNESKAKASAALAGRRADPAAIARAVATRMAKAPQFMFVHPQSGRRFNGTARDFQRESGLDQSYVSLLTRGKVLRAKGWVLRGNEAAPVGNRDRTIRVFRHKDGRVFEGTAYDFNAMHIRDSGMLSNCIKGKNGVKSARGWVYVGERTNAAAD